MIIGGRRASFLLFVGDIAAFALSLYLTLWVRYGDAPTAAALAPYVLPFSFLFALWILVFYSAGLYSKRLALFPSRLPDALLYTQLANIVFAALFFFLVPTFGIAPKTILLLYFLVSLAVIYLWRLTLYPRLSLPRTRECAALIAEGPEADELYAEVNGNPRYGVRFCARLAGGTLESGAALRRELERASASILVADIAHRDAERILPLVYALARADGRYPFVPFEDMYEEVFDRIPLSQLGHAWFLANVAPETPLVYAVVKRAIDVVGGLVMGLVTLAAAPFIAAANALEGPGPLFITQDRIGKNGTRMTSCKFRSMRENLSASGEWVNEGQNRVTKVGAFLRKTSLDEFPQCVNVLKGELSLVGPRNDIRGLAKRLREALPYYEARYLVVPGITGWAQINQQYEPGNASPQSIEETKTRLAYDFYYLKHRSLGLDLIIALKTVKRMFFRVSS